MMVAPSEVEDSSASRRSRGRNPPRAGHAAPVHRRDHRNDQGQHPCADRVRGRLAGGLPGDPRPGRRRDTARAGGHAVPPGGDLEAAANPGRVRDRGGDRAPHKHWSRQGEPEFAEELLETRPEAADEEGEASCPPIRTTCSRSSSNGGGLDPDGVGVDDPARLRVGYTRAGRLIDMLERRGVISGLRGLEAAPGPGLEGELPRVLERLDSPHEDPAPSRWPLERSRHSRGVSSSKIAVAWRLSWEATTRSRSGRSSRTPATGRGSISKRSRSGRRFARSTSARSRTRTGAARVRARVHSRLRRRGRNRLGGARRRVPAAPRSADGTLSTPSPCCVGVGESVRGASAACDPRSDRRRDRHPAVLGLTAGHDDDGASGRQGAPGAPARLAGRRR